MNLLLLTAAFPYHPGEEFIEGEISVLAKIFQKITIVPLFLQFPGKGLPPRSVPPNVDVLLLPQDLTKQSRRKILLQTTPLLPSAKSIVIAAMNGGSLQPSKFRYLCARYFDAALFASLITQKINIQHYDIIYSYWGEEKGLVLHLLRGYQTKQKIFVSRLHGYDLYAERRGLRRLPFQKLLLNACDTVVPCSREGATYLQRLYPEQSGKVQYSHLGVASQNVLNRGSADDILRIVTCSFILPVKRLDLIIAALRGVSRKVIWTHMGDGEGTQEMILLSKQLPSNVQTLFTGHLDNGDVLNHYRNHPVDLFVNVSSHEGIPVSIMEALSFGIETIATNVGGLSELVSPEFGTLLEPAFKPEQLSEILQAHRNCQARRIKAKEHQEKNFSFENYQSFAARLVALFRGENGDS